MHNIELTMEAMTHVAFAGMRKVIPEAAFENDAERRDRGAVSLEQALWYAAAAAMTGGVAVIVWNAVTDQANTSVVPGPSAG